MPLRPDVEERAPVRARGGLEQDGQDQRKRWCLRRLFAGSPSRSSSRSLRRARSVAVSVEPARSLAFRKASS